MGEKDSRRNNKGWYLEKGIKGMVACKIRPASTPVWLSSVPDQRSLSYLLSFVKSLLICLCICTLSHVYVKLQELHASY